MAKSSRERLTLDDRHLPGRHSRHGELFPDGSKLAKIHWNAKKSAEAPDPTIVPDTLHDIDFMVKDSKRFPDTGGWGYAEFDYAPASDTFTPLGSGTNCGYECHRLAV